MKIKWTHEGPCRIISKLAMPKILEGRDKIMEHLILLLSTPSTTYPHTCTSWSWLYDLLTLWVWSLTLQNIWNKYALVFLPTLSSTKAFRSRRKKAHKKALVRIKTPLSEWECHPRNLFLFFENFWKPRDVILSKEWGKWCFMNHSMSQQPKTRRRPKAPQKLR